MVRNTTEVEDFDAVKISLASPEEILKWSFGEVTKPETINYRTQKPERDGLFCERIFGPTKDWECYCGKYKKIRYKGIVCEKCGVEVTKSIVRRERMGHINLAVPVVHIWYLRGTPSRIGLMLDIPIKDLERVVYFGGYIITEVNEEARAKMLTKIEEEAKSKSEKLKKEYEKAVSKVKSEYEKAVKKLTGSKKKEEEEKLSQLLRSMEKENKKALEDIEKEKMALGEELNNLTKKQVITELKYWDLLKKYPGVFKASIGAEAIYQLLSEIDLDKLAQELREKIARAGGQTKKRHQKRLRLIESFRKNNKRPEWMILSVLPVIPPDLRPMVELDGGRFATSDLNDLYRRVINRNNRLKKLLELGAPEVICRNEKRMLQEAVDALIDNSAKHGRAVTTQAGRKLKSLSDILRGKQGRFRQNLLGKRVDYSGRSVIVVGPELKLHQCGLPKKMALELFRPFVIGRLIKLGLAHNVKSASRMIEQSKPEVWDILEEIISQYYVLLNRAPTLHRLGIQAFQPVLIEGNAIQIHPLVCAAFNADFDGDQMAVHVPLSQMAQWEAKEIMVSSKNILKPADGSPLVSPTQDIVLGCYYLTREKEGAKGEGRAFKDFNEAIYAYNLGNIELQAKIKVKIKNKLIETTVGRIIFNEVLPEGFDYQNIVMNKKNLKNLVSDCFKRYGVEVTTQLVDKIKDLGFDYARKSGVTFSIFDINIPSEKSNILSEAEAKSAEVTNQYKRGLITDQERYIKIIEIWNQARDDLERVMTEEMDRSNPAFWILDSGARGDVAQASQLGGMKGLVVNPAGEIIELPIKANYREGFSVLEYFIAMHGSRKGKSDTALRTSDAGYLTRRLVDVSQDVIISSQDCGDNEGITFYKNESLESFVERIKGRIALESVKNKKGEIIVKKGEIITEEIAAEIDKYCESIKVRTPLSCQNLWGVCQKCYGLNLARGTMVEEGEAVGIIAAQSIGEPGTQLTMRTFHTGGVARADITQGLPRVEELFEARAPRAEAVIAEISGLVKIKDKANERKIIIIPEKENFEEFKLPPTAKLKVSNNESVSAGQIIAQIPSKKSIRAKEDGIVKIKDKVLKIIYSAKEKEYLVPSHLNLLVSPNEKVEAGQKLTEGHINLQKLFKLKGERAVQKYIVAEVQDIYNSQGQTISDKHIEIIVRQMFSKVRIKDPGDSKLLAGEVIDRILAKNINDELISKGKKPAEFEVLLLGITKVALLTSSFLSAASFQETTKILTDAAINGTIDRLRGLKENVIIGRLIPAGTGFNKKLEKLMEEDKAATPDKRTDHSRESRSDIEVDATNKEETKRNELEASVDEVKEIMDEEISSDD